MNDTGWSASVSPVLHQSYVVTCKKKGEGERKGRGMGCTLDTQNHTFVNFMGGKNARRVRKERARRREKPTEESRLTSPPTFGQPWSSWTSGGERRRSYAKANEETENGEKVYKGSLDFRKPPKRRSVYVFLIYNKLPNVRFM